MANFKGYPRLVAHKSILNAAIALIENGWVQNTRRRKINGTMHFCAHGAIHQVSRTSIKAREVIGRVQDILGLISLVQWNDKPGMRKSTVVKKLKSVVQYL